jgi:hypothetical protein
MREAPRPFDQRLLIFERTRGFCLRYEILRVFGGDHGDVLQAHVCCLGAPVHSASAGLRLRQV